MSINLTGESLIDQLKKVEEEAQAECRNFTTLSELEDFRIKYLARKGILAEIFENLKSLSAEEKPQVGKLANQVKLKVEELFERRLLELKSQDSKRGKEALDYTLPGRKGWKGSLHPLTQVRDEIVDIFYGMGFEVVYGPEVETDYYNFEALNIPPDHPARDMWDTFYVAPQDTPTRDKWDTTRYVPPPDILLRTHTSPMQARTLELVGGGPVRVIVPGRCYRYEAQDASHEWMFYQVEGLAVAEGLTMADLKGTLGAFVRQLFGRDLRIRFRCDYFPFVEPGVDMSISCHVCGGSGCRVCKGGGWIEIMGAGMVHPRVLEMA